MRSDTWFVPLIVFVAASLGFAAVLAALRQSYGHYRDRFDRTVGNELRAAFLFTSVARLFVLNLSVVLASGLLALWLTGRILPAIGVALLVGLLPRLAVRWLRRRRIQSFRQQMPELLSLLAVSLKAGASLNAALAELAEQMPPPARQEFSMVLREQRMGRPLDAALVSLETRLPVEETVLLVSALRLGLRAGGSMAGTLQSLSGATRRRLMLEGKVRALTAQGRMQAWVMGLLPFVVLGALLTIQPELIDLYFGTTAGLSVLAVVALLQLAGAWVISRMVAIEI